MKRFGFFVLLLIFGTPNSVIAQNLDDYYSSKEKVFLFELRAEKDATYEQSLVFHNKKDEMDFWQDQKQYEKDLEKWDEVVYTIYMNAKKEIYLKHIEHCGEHCNHGKFYYQQRSYYATYQSDGPFPMQTISLVGKGQIGLLNSGVGIFR